MQAYPARNVGVLLVCASLIVALALGIRHSFGLFLLPMSMDLGWGREVFSLAIALQNLVWGATQPFSGWLADRYGAGRVIAGGALCYAGGLFMMAHAGGPTGLNLSAGLLIGIGLSGTTFSVVYGAVGRAVAPERRVQALALVGAAGSLGQFLMVPLGHQVIELFGWFAALLVLAVAGAMIAPLSLGAAERGREPWLGGRGQSAGEALREAFGERSFRLLAAGFFVCGFQVVFIGAHLPSYLMDAGLSAREGMLALALIGLFNIFGTYLFGALGAHLSKKRVLSALYLARSMIIVAFLLAPVSVTSVVLFSSAMGLLWLGTVPLTNALVAQIFGVRYLAMLSGFVFFSHQVGSFLGVWLGGVLFEYGGSYQAAWVICVLLGIAAALLHLPVDERPLGRLTMVGAR